MIRYFEYAVSEGEGTLTMHYVRACFLGYSGLPYPPPRITGFICETITKKRYAEFIAIHGSEVAV